MQDVGRVFGEVVGGKAFGDWSLRPEDGREFAEHDIGPYHAPRTSAGKDRSDPAILLEVYEWIRDREDRGTVILGSGDADYQALVDRARVHGRRIVLCAFSQSVSPDMLARPRYSRLRPSWVSSWRNTATSTWTSRLIPRGGDAGHRRCPGAVHSGDVQAGRPAEACRLQHAVQSVDAGLGIALERARVQPADRRVPVGWDRGTP